MQRVFDEADRLLGPDDPLPVEVLGDPAPLLLTVEHGGRAVPRGLGDLGLAPGEIDRHIGWDPGAWALARALHARRRSAVVVQPYSRLVIDVNRPRHAPDLVPEQSDGTVVPANRALGGREIAARWEEIHRPFHAAVEARCAAGARALVAIHTYDPQRRGDAAARPWPVGLLWRQENPFAARLAERLAREPAVQPLGRNAPYEIEDDGDYTIPVHAEARGLGHVLIEVRNDHLADAAAVARMAEILARALPEPEAP